jgi:serine/threonine protein kinase
MYARMPRTAIHYNDKSSRGPAITAEELKHQLVLTHVLGQGGSGVAFQAHFRGQDVVVKLPIRLLKGQLPASKKGWTLTDVLRPKNEQSSDQFTEAHRVMEIECHNAECALEPLELQQLRVREHAGLLGADRPVPEQFRNPSSGLHSPPPEWKEISGRALRRGLPPPSKLTDEVHKALFRWHSHRGYWHMHPVIHYDRDIPLLMSEPALGTIDALRFEVNESTRMPTHWLDVAWQLSEAIRFLHDLPRLAHVDIKPSNVLFTLPSPTRCHIWLSDYGDLYPMHMHTDFRQGTPLYKPKTFHTFNRFKDVKATFLQQSLYMYFATLMDLFVPVGKRHSMPHGWFFANQLNIGQSIDDGSFPSAFRPFLERQRSTQMLWASLCYYRFENLVPNFQRFRDFVSRELSPRR